MFQVSGIEKRDGEADNLWFAYAKSEASAENIKKLFIMAGYEKVNFKNIEDYKI